MYLCVRNCSHGRKKWQFGTFYLLKKQTRLDEKDVGFYNRGAAGGGAVRL